jgi:hypothetical protein
MPRRSEAIGGRRGCTSQDGEVVERNLGWTIPPQELPRVAEQSFAAAREMHHCFLSLGTTRMDSSIRVLLRSSCVE